MKKELTDKERETLTYLLDNIGDIAGELIAIGKGGRLGQPAGVWLKVDDEIEIYIRKSNNPNMSYDFEAFFKSTLVMKACISQNSQAIYSEGPEEYSLSVTLKDAYNREGDDTRHDIDLSFSKLMELIDTYITTPIKEKISEQNLYKDMMYDEFTEKLKNL